MALNMYSKPQEQSFNNSSKVKAHLFIFINSVSLVPDFLQKLGGLTEAGQNFSLRNSDHLYPLPLGTKEVCRKKFLRCF